MGKLRLNPLGFWFLALGVEQPEGGKASSQTRWPRLESCLHTHWPGDLGLHALDLWEPQFPQGQKEGKNGRWQWRLGCEFEWGMETNVLSNVVGWARCPSSVWGPLLCIFSAVLLLHEHLICSEFFKDLAYVLVSRVLESRTPAPSSQLEEGKDGGPGQWAVIEGYPQSGLPTPSHPSGSSQSTEISSLYYIAASYWLSIYLYDNV